MALNTKTFIGWHKGCGGAVYTLSLGNQGNDRMCNKCPARKSNGSLGLDKVTENPYDPDVVDLISAEVLANIQKVTKNM